MDDLLLQRLAAIVQIVQFIASILMSILLFFWNRRNQVWNVLLKKPKVTITLLLIVTMISSLSTSVFFAQSAFRPGQGTNPNTFTSTPASGISPTAISSSNTSSTPLPSPTASATALPDGKVLCEAGEAKGWNGWNIQVPWVASGKNILHNGSRTAYLTAPATCQPAQPNYAVEIKMIWRGYNGRAGLFVRETDDKRYLVDMDTIANKLWITYLDGFNQEKIAPSDLDVSDVHTYRVEAIENAINCKFDNRLIASFHENSLLSPPGKVGIYSQTQIDVISFRVILLGT